ncbi:MAG: GNAT family N-acetyltransferase [Gemmataceae bacterium]|nr:GNAT family N-acetyltransferase [Gemmataceae bacterium]
MPDESNPCQADEPFVVRPARPDEVGLFRAAAEAEGWNPGRHDGPCFFAADPGGMMVGEPAGRPVATISCVRYGDGYGFLGQYIVRPEYRGRGFGRRLWTAGFARFGTRNVGLDGVLEQVANYERSGFRTSHHHVRYGGAPAGRSAPGLVRLDAVPFDDVLAYDRRCFPGPRADFLRMWIAQPEGAALGLVRDGRLAGYAVARRATDGFKVGPLFADDDPAAEALLLGLVKEVGGPVVADVPEAAAHPSAERLVLNLGMAEVFRAARMYTRGRPAADDARVYGVTSLELG